MSLARPTRKPANPRFSSGPCAKRPGWSAAALQGAAVGLSHRSKIGKDRLARVIERSKALLEMPADWRLAVVPGSDTGAVEMTLWSLLGPRGVDVVAFDAFGRDWARDLKSELKLADLRLFEAPYGKLPDLSQIDPARDLVFTWNGTTSGVRVPDAHWIAEQRQGLALCDATSAVFAMALDWTRLDVVTWSWQKVLGGEGAHGMLALSPRAVERLLTHKPAWPMPKLFRMTNGGKLNEGLFRGETINTPSLLAVEDQLDALCWAETQGGLPALIRRSEENFRAVERWVEASDWIDFLAEDPRTRSTTAICLKVTDPWFAALSAEAQGAHLKSLTGLLEAEAVAYDIGAYRDAPAGLRLWGGATVETSDLEALLPWLDWAHGNLRHAKAA